MMRRHSSMDALDTMDLDYPASDPMQGLPSPAGMSIQDAVAIIYGGSDDYPPQAQYPQLQFDDFLRRFENSSASPDGSLLTDAIAQPPAGFSLTQAYESRNEADTSLDERAEIPRHDSLFNLLSRNSDEEEEKSAEVRLLKRFACAEFAWDKCPHFLVSSFVSNALDMEHTDIMRYLGQPSVQRDRNESERRRNGEVFTVEYDFVHFKTADFDEVFSRKALHYEIAQALARQHAAENQIREKGCKILYAVGDAQIVLLLDSLRSKADGYYSVLYDPAETKEIDVMDKDQTGREIRLRKETQLGDPYYLRTITDDAVARAFQSLIAPCIMFCAGDKVPRERKPVETKEWNIHGMSEREVAREKAEKEKAEQAKNKKRKTNQGNTEAAGAPSVETQQQVQIEGKDYTVRPWQACAFFEDKVVEGMLTFDTTVEFWELPSNELAMQPAGLFRREGFKKVEFNPPEESIKVEKQPRPSSRYGLR